MIAFFQTRQEWRRYRLLAFTGDDLGTAVAYNDADSGRLESHPRANDKINTSALFVIVNDEAKANIDQVRNAVAVA